MGFISITVLSSCHNTQTRCEYCRGPLSTCHVLITDQSQGFIAFEFLLVSSAWEGRWYAEGKTVNSVWRKWWIKSPVVLCLHRAWMTRAGSAWGHLNFPIHEKTGLHSQGWMVFLESLPCHLVLSAIVLISVSFNYGSWDPKGTSVLVSELGICFSIQMIRKMSILYGSPNVDGEWVSHLTTINSIFIWVWLICILWVVSGYIDICGLNLHMR